MITKLAESPLATKFGVFTETLFRTENREALCLQLGDLSDKTGVLVRVHSQCITGHVFNGVECDCVLQMEYSQGLIAAQDLGLIIWLDHEGKGNGHLAKMRSVPFKHQGYSQELAYEKAGYPRDNRDYSLVADVLSYFRVRSIKLITNNPRKQRALVDLGVTIEGLVHTPAIHDLTWNQRIDSGG